MNRVLAAPEDFRPAADDRLAEMERQIAALQRLITELLVKNQQLRERANAQS